MNPNLFRFGVPRTPHARNASRQHARPYASFFTAEKLEFRAMSADLQRMVVKTNEPSRQIRGVDYPIQRRNIVIDYALQN